jgi:type 1 glutamine amidotransferase
MWSSAAALGAVLCVVAGGCALNDSTTADAGTDTGSAGKAPSGPDSGARGASESGTGSTADATMDTTGAAGDAVAGLDVVASDGSGDSGLPPSDAAGSNKILIYGVTSPGTYRHGMIPVAAAAIAQAASVVGLTSEIVGASDAINVADPTKFTAAALAQDGAVVLLCNDGEPYGSPGTQEIQNLVDYVQNGGALIVLHCTPDSYGGSASIFPHPASIPFHMLIGSTFLGHPGNVAPATCTTMGTHPSVAHLATTFNVTDEIYSFSYVRPDNQLVMTCISSVDTKTVRPISWYREEGSGRVFNVALGHPDASWMMPMDPKLPNTRLLEDHVIPGLLWAMKR